MPFPISELLISSPETDIGQRADNSPEIIKKGMH